MGVNQNDLARITKALREMPKKIEEVVVRILSATGLEITNKIKDRPNSKPNWTDRTGNLRSSIGFIVFVDGKEREVGGFDLQNNTGSDPSSGIGIGQDFADQFMKSLSASRYMLVIVAGMNYAEYLEKKDYDVVLFMEQEARQTVKKQIEVMSKQIREAIKRLIE